ncbi:MAG TPA: ATPase [Clostridia bacterium]|nr:ATPase [Clostridia bacterium]
MKEEFDLDYGSEIKAIKNKYEQLRIYYFNEMGKKEQLVNSRSILENTLQKILDNIDMLEEVRILLQKVSEFAREQARLQIETLVTNCLQYIFDSNIEFRITIEEVRGRPEAEFYVVSDIGGEKVVTKPQESRGGGVVDIISLSLRIAMLQCSNLDINGPIILDEPAKHVSDEYITQVAEFLKQVGGMFERQIIMVTHDRHLSEIADKWFKVEIEDGISKAVIDS